MPRYTPLRPIFDVKARRGSIVTGSQVGLATTICGWIAGTASVQGSDLMTGGNASTVGSDVIFGGDADDVGC